MLLRLFSLSAVYVFAVGYILLNARSDWYADLFLLTLLFVALPRLLYSEGASDTVKKWLIWCVWGYLGLALLSVFFPQSTYISYGWIAKSFFRIGVMALVVLAAQVQNPQEQRAVSRLLPIIWLILMGMIFLISKGFVDKESLEFLTPWSVAQTAVNRKSFSFVLLFLMWAVVALLWRKEQWKKILAIGVILLTLFVLLSSTSKSSVIAWAVSVAVFAGALIPVARGRYPLYLTVFLLFLVIPLLWMVFTPVMTQDPWEIYDDTTGMFLRKHWTSIGVRLYLYDFCAELARKEFLFGQGFGSTLSLPVPDGELPGWSVFPGGHPHNVVFLLLIEQGFLGFLWLSTMTVLLFNYLYRVTLDSVLHGPAIWALAISGQVIFSLSFSIWHADVVLTYGLFFMLLFVVSNGSERQEHA